MVQADARNVELIAQTDLDGYGDCMMVQVVDDVAYVAHMGTDGTGTSVVDVSDMSNPRVIRHIDTPSPGTRSHKVVVTDDVMIVNSERNPFTGPGGSRRLADEWKPGLRVFDVSDRRNPVDVGFLEMNGDGVHRMSFTQAPYAFASASDDGYSGKFMMNIDLSDPANPIEAGRWWVPGMRTGAGETPTWDPSRDVKAHHGIERGDRLYCGWWDYGLIILDISDVAQPKLVSHLDLGSDVSARTHTALPLEGRDLLIVTDEGDADCTGLKKLIRVVDISDETNPKVVSTFPEPEGDFASAGGWCGPHNLHEMRPGTFQSDRIIHATHFNAGLRVYDTEDPLNVREIAHYLPTGTRNPVQFNDLTVLEDGTVLATDRTGGGLYILKVTL